MAVIYWAGDSTVKQNSILTYPQTGIGQVFHLYLRPDVRVENHAENGRSTKSFLDEGRLARIEERMQGGDFLFIQFGHNDEKIDDPARYTDPNGVFVENLALYVRVARDRGAMPVLITPLTRRNWRDPGIAFSHAEHANAMRETAARLSVPLVDLCARSEALVDALGEQSAAYFMHVPAGKYPYYPDGLVDDTHLRPEGAIAFAALVAEALFMLGEPYASLLVEGYGQWLAEQKRVEG